VSVVVSDTSPLHYLILCGEEKILPRLFNRVLVPPTVFRELQQTNTPVSVREWAKSLPTWCAVQSPSKTDLPLDIDPGELEALCLAKEVHADAVLMDDRAGRLAAVKCGLAVVGTIGILEAAAAREWINFAQAIRKLRATNARLNPGLIEAALARDAARKHTH
jgi:predicted nucleic acid-binding protein